MAYMLNNQVRHIDYSILSEPFSPMYKMHRYWGRKPWNIFREYIRNYTREGDIILDSFSGSGVAAAEALKLGRRVIAIDINPIATFIAQQTVVPVDLLKFEYAFEELLAQVQPLVNEEYFTICRSCKGRAQVIHFKWGREKLLKRVPLDHIKRTLLGIRYSCENCGSIADVLPNSYDFERAERDHRYVINDYLSRFTPQPKKKLRTTRKSEAGDDYFKLFTPRNLFLLCVLYEAIEKIKDESIKNTMKLVFTSALEKSSKLLMYTGKGVAKGGVRSKSWVAPRFHIQRNHLEKNPLINFQNSFKRVFEGKREINKEITDSRPAKSVEDVFSKTANVYVDTADIDFLNKLPPRSIDYAMVDPPFVEDIQYLELSQIWLNWLGLEPNWEKEIKIKPRLTDYTRRLTQAFKKIYRVLKPNGYLTVLYQTEDINLWDIMVRAPVSAGFELCKLVPQGVRYSYGGKYRTLLAQPSGRKFFLGHYYLTFTRPKDERTKKLAPNIERKVVIQTKELIRRRNEPTPLIFILLNLYEVLSRSELEELSVKKVIEILSNSPELQREQEKLNGQMWGKWFIKDVSEIDEKRSLREMVKQDLAEMLLFERNRGTTYYIQGILNKFKGKLIVSSQRVKNLLDELSEERRSGNLVTRVLKNEAEVATQKQHELTRNLGDLGRTYGFNFTFIRDLGVFWEKEGRPLVLFYIALTQNSLRLLPSTVQKLNEIVSKGGFRRVLIIPERLKSDFLRKSEEQWDYILVEDLDKFLYEKTIIDRAIVREEKRERLKKRKLKAKVIDKKTFQIDGDVRYFKLILETGYVERHALAGQFVNILCHPKNKGGVKVFQNEEEYYSQRRVLKREKEQCPLLRRPISIHRIYYEHFDPKTLKGIREIPPEFARLLHPGSRGRFDILVKVVGVGTKWLSHVKVGDNIDIIGPLGNGFTLRPELKKALVVAGGIGIAPLYALAERLRWEGKEVMLFLGAYEEKDLRILEWDFGHDISYGMKEHDIMWLSREFQQTGIDVKICTIKGRSRERGLVTEIFERYLEQNNNSFTGTEVFSCGPRAMLKSLASITKRYKLPHQVLLEEVMGCGIGACLSCVCPIKTGDGGFEYKRACVDGPVFDADKVYWDAY